MGFVDDDGVFFGFFFFDLLVDNVEFLHGCDDYTDVVVDGFSEVFGGFGFSDDLE